MPADSAYMDYYFMKKLFQIAVACIYKATSMHYKMPHCSVFMHYYASFVFEAGTVFFLYLLLLLFIFTTTTTTDLLLGVL